MKRERGDPYLRLKPNSTKNTTKPKSKTKRKRERGDPKLRLKERERKRRNKTTGIATTPSSHHHRIHHCMATSITILVHPPIRFSQDQRKLEEALHQGSGFEKNLTHHGGNRANLAMEVVRQRLGLGV